MADRSVSHSFEDETFEAKVRWFQSLTLEERMEIFFEWSDLALAIRPELANSKPPRAIPGRVQVVELSRAYEC